MYPARSKTTVVIFLSKHFLAISSPTFAAPSTLPPFLSLSESLALLQRVTPLTSSITWQEMCLLLLKTQSLGFSLVPEIFSLTRSCFLTRTKFLLTVLIIYYLLTSLQCLMHQ